MSSRGGRLPRRRAAMSGEPSLEEAAAERIDAITAEPLHPNKYIEIMSPDGTLRLFYNTATLIRIATDRGMFMQPPHFREPMSPAMQQQVETIEGRTFHFEKSNVTLHDSVSGGLHVLHRHVYFDQIMDEFYLLNPTELYVCPACYLHWVGTRFIPHLTATRQRIEYTANEPNPVIDPLDVLAHMQGVGNVSADGAGENTEDLPRRDVTEVEMVPLTIPSTNELPDWDSPLVHIVFRRAVSWKRHVRRHHNCTPTSAMDYRLKEFLSQYISHYNRLLEEKSRKRRRDVDNAATRGPTLTVSRYWHINARYNRLRYNRIVEAVERAEEHIDECTEWMAFRGETVTNTFHSAEKDSSGSDFICDSDSSIGSDYDGFPRYEGPPCSDEEEEDAEKSTKNARKRLRPRTERTRGSSSSTTTTTTTSSSSTTSFSEEEEHEEEEEEGADDDDDDDDDDAWGGDDKIQQQRRLFKSGLLAPFPTSYRNLSYDERRVLETESRRVVKPTSLYIPPTEEKMGVGVDCNGDADDAADDYIDWGQIGETIENADTYVRDMQKRLCVNAATDVLPAPLSANATAATPQTRARAGREAAVNDGATDGMCTHAVQTGDKSAVRPGLILDDDDNDVTAPVTSMPQGASPPGAQRHLLLDDSE